MTARVAPTFKVPVSLVPKLSYFSQYHAVVKRSIWDPLAPGVLGGARDLVGRAVIIATVLFAGYLIMALFSTHFWYTAPPMSVAPSTIDQRMCRFFSQKRTQHLCGPKNLSGIYTAPHIHQQSIDPTFSLPQTGIFDLCNVENLQEEECIYPEDKLTGEIKQIRSLMDPPMEPSKAEPLVKYIGQMVEREKVVNESELAETKQSMGYALGALFVFLGIKPALAMYGKPDKELFSLLTDLAKEHDNLCLKAPDGSGSMCFVNEKPLLCFDPRNFLNLSPDVLSLDKPLTEAVALCFPEQNQRDADQFLSYLLGFGPSWENYALYTDYLYQEKASVSCIFKADHYYEIGNVLQQRLFSQENRDRSEIEKLGFTFHSQFASLIERSDLIPSTIATTLAKTGTDQIFDGLTARTDYFQKSYTLKKWVMDTYFSQPL